MKLITKIYKNINKQPVRQFFWQSNKNQSQQEEESEDITGMQNLKFLIEQIKKENQKKTRLLPQKQDNKLTVVLEMDEVLLYTFYPDEQEVRFYILDIYALASKDVVDPNRIIKHRLYQDSCNKVLLEEENIDDFVKDLDRLGRSLERTVYIDCKPITFWPNPDNVLDFFADNSQKDDDLERLIDLLEEIKGETDVRKILIDRFGIRNSLEESNMV